MPTTTEITVGLYMTRNGMTASIFRVAVEGEVTKFPIRGIVWRESPDTQRPRTLAAMWLPDGRHSTVGPDDWDLVERLPDRPKQDAAIALGGSETGEGIPTPTPDATKAETK